MASAEVHLNTPFGYYDFEQPEYLWLLLALVPIVLLVRWTRRTRTAKRVGFSRFAGAGVVAARLGPRWIDAENAN